MTAPPIRLVVVEDSPLVREALVEMFTEEPGLEVVAVAGSGAEAIDAIVAHRPDIVTLDLGLPDFDGFEVIRRVMAEAPLPILVLTATLRPRGRREAYFALSLGAVHVMEKPEAAQLADASWRRRLRDEIAFLSRIKVIPHIGRRVQPERKPAADPATLVRAPIKMVVVVASAGGPRAVRDLLAAVPERSPPIVVGMHLGKNLGHELVRYLDDGSRVPVQLAQPGEPLEPGIAYVLPGGQHAEFASERRLRMFEHLPASSWAPSLDHLLGSAADRFGDAAMGVVLTGMGADGAAGLLRLRQVGGFTCAQDEASSLIFGMPNEAYRRGAVLKVGPPATLGSLVPDRDGEDDPL